MFVSITKQLKRAFNAVKSVLVVAGTATAVLDPKLRFYLREGEQLDGIGMIQLTLVRWIEDDHNHLEDQETEHRATLRKLKLLRMQREKEQGVLYTKMLRIRKRFEDAFGQGTAPVYLGLEPRLGDVEPLVLRRHAGETVGILTDPTFSTPEPDVEGVWDNPLQYAEQIRTALHPFQMTIDEIESQKKVVDIALKAKTELLDELKDRLKWSIRLFEAIYQLAGQGFHAERLRLTVSARPSPDETDDEKSEDGEEKAKDGGEEPQPAAEASETSQAEA